MARPGSKVSMVKSMLAKVGSVIESNAKKITPAQLSAVSKRIGKTVTSPAELARLAKENPMTAAMIVYEVYGVSHPLVAELLEADPSLEHVFMMSDPIDSVAESTSVNDITKFTDEFAAITRASRQLGGFERFMTLRRALAMPDDVVELYVQFKAMARNL